jgi:hypothetical protein
MPWPALLDYCGKVLHRFHMVAIFLAKVSDEVQEFFR